RTTCVACVVQEDKAHWAHVGDSRLYMFRRAQLVAQTKDHSKVQYLLDQGAIQPEQAAKHPDRNKIFSCLGGFADPAIDVSTQMDEALTLTDPKVNNRDLTDEEIERAIDEIQSTIKRYGGK